MLSILLHPHRSRRRRLGVDDIFQKEENDGLVGNKLLGSNRNRPEGFFSSFLAANGGQMAPVVLFRDKPRIRNESR